MNTMKKWTREEEMSLADKIKNSPENLAECFRQHSLEYGRTFHSVRLKWYSCLSIPTNPRYVGTCFTMISHRRNFRNGKVYIQGRSNREPENIIQRVRNTIQKLFS